MYDLRVNQEFIRPFTDDRACSFRFIISRMFGAIIIALWLLCLLGIPALAIFSIREWVSSQRATLSTLRNWIGVGSVGAIFCGWLFLVVLTILRIINDTWMDFFTEHRNFVFLVLAVTASVTSLTLTGKARVCAVAAGLLLALYAMLWLSRDMP